MGTLTLSDSPVSIILRAFDADAMANCLLWKFAVLALVASTARAAVIVDPVEADEIGTMSLSRLMQYIEQQQFSAYRETWGEMIKKIESSLEGVEKAADGMVVNFLKYGWKLLEQFGKFNNELGPHIKEF